MEFLPFIILTAGLVTGFGIMSYVHYRVMRTLAVFKVAPSTLEARQLLRAIEEVPQVKEVKKFEPEGMPENLGKDALAAIRAQQ